MSQNKTTLRDLVDRARKKNDPPLTMASMADRCCTTRPHFYEIVNGRKRARPGRMSVISKQLGVTVRTVNDAWKRANAASTKKRTPRKRRRA